MPSPLRGEGGGRDTERKREREESFSFEILLRQNLSLLFLLFIYCNMHPPNRIEIIYVKFACIVSRYPEK